ncbi:sigmaY antisigma factor component [Symbiobacterium thermophilum]|uniref:SigmaY antisigma factor component n=1 Tax=Symbiobacterium thermophilum TaxID=2734 RepID=A0A953I0X5_SYMTR|nr:sigmaY antisigma factor component [Symbiobacterium thermophilum]MBY6275520.1 sigmaY antisigma factor component [Symbiobacterium thermophilum]
MNDPRALPWWAWVLVGLILGAQGVLLFLDARRRGARAWFWGLIGLIHFPTPTLLYWLLVVRRGRPH